MKILIVNEYIDGRGAEEIVKKQFQLLEQHGINVHMLAFHASQDMRQLDAKKYTIIEIPKVYKLTFSFYYYYKIRKIIKKINPDYILVHNIFSAPFTIYRTFKGYHVVQTVHDYKIVCPTAMCIQKDTRAVCNGYDTEKCMNHCAQKKNRIILRVQLHIVKRTEILRKRYIWYFISPSQKLKHYMLSYGYQVVCINNPIEQIKDSLSSHSVNKNHIKFVYAGAICREKGITPFLEYLKSRNESFDVDVYGEVTDDTDIESLKNTHKIHFKGKLPHSQLLKILDQYDYMIVPSMWQENYPTTILEAMSCGVVVIGSDRGGIPEMLNQNRGYIYPYGMVAELNHIMDDVFASSNSEYEAIRNNAYHYVCANNSMEHYYQQLVDLLSMK